MIGRFRYGKLANYPHMKPEDVAIWERFLAAYPNYFETCDYDVAVGAGRMPAEPQAENDARGWAALTRKKIDVVGYTKDFIAVIEVKPRARANALGQVWMYDELYREDYQTNLPVRNIIITDDIDPDTLKVAKTGDIEMIAV